MRECAGREVGGGNLTATKQDYLLHLREILSGRSPKTADDPLEPWPLLKSRWQLMALRGAAAQGAALRQDRP